jgi:formylglycine-generating enzyme required for sulfatase activity
VQYCNALSEREGLEPCYVCTGAEDAAVCELAPGYETPYECEGYRLPTEAEWEYAARAGTTTDTFSFDFQWGMRECDPYQHMDAIAWYCTMTTHPVAELLPNPWGLYDVIGNVGELTADHLCGAFEDCEPTHDVPEEPVTDPYHDVDWPFRVYRGCGWINQLEDCKLSAIYGLGAADRDVAVGFRPARTRLDIGAEVDE